VPEERIFRYGEDENYWFSGDVGPCGPDSEIFYDFGPQPDCESCEPAHDGHRRFLEIWNLVFMTYYQHEDGSRTDLPTKNIDTGCGLERISAALNRNYDLYATDIFRPLVGRIEELSGKTYGRDEETTRAFRVVAEHARALTFLVSDGVTPSNEGRGYVLRRLLRRAVYFGRRLGLSGVFVSPLAETAIDNEVAAFPELEHQRAAILRLIRDEEERFSETLRRGIEVLEGIVGSASGRVIEGQDTFRLYDTFGLPLELTREIAAERGFTVDQEGFEREMTAQRERARASGRFAADEGEETLIAALATVDSQFVGYDATEAETAVRALVTGDSLVDEVAEGDECGIVLAITPFYPEGGGQVGDAGRITSVAAEVEIEDTQRLGETAIVHRGRVVRGALKRGDGVTAAVDMARRGATMRNHTATHLVHAALRTVLGPHVRQTGSLVAPDRLRFDFSHSHALTDDEVRQVERLVNEKVRQDVPVSTRFTGYQEAIGEGVLAFFGDKYGAEVRVVEVPNGVAFASAELCGGTHCHHTGQVGYFIITSEGSVGAGVRRIEALTAGAAEDWAAEQRARLREIGDLLGADPMGRVKTMTAELDGYRKRLASAERERTRGSLQALLDQATSVNGAQVLSARVEASTAEAMRELADSLRERIPSGIVVLGAVLDGKPAFLAMVTSDLTQKGVHAGQLVKRVAEVTGGGGGGRPDLAQAGGRDASKLEAALSVGLDSAREILQGTPG
jgi:alanyl-tRNA synthetase